VTNEAYASQIARDWNVKASGVGFVTKFDVDAYYLSRYRIEKVGGAIHGPCRESNLRPID
jgi:hypothetical protein